MLRATADPAHEAPRGQTLVILSELIVDPAILAPNGSSNASEFLSFQGLCPCSSTPYLSFPCLLNTYSLLGFHHKHHFLSKAFLVSLFYGFTTSVSSLYTICQNL